MISAYPCCPCRAPEGRSCDSHGSPERGSSDSRIFSLLRAVHHEGDKKGKVSWGLGFRENLEAGFWRLERSPTAGTVMKGTWMAKSPNPSARL